MIPRIGILGSKGRMGQWVDRLLTTEYSSRVEVHSRVDRDHSTDGDFARLLESDAVIDFSSPAAVLDVMRRADCADAQLPVFIIGCTGWRPEERAKLEAFANRSPVLISGNFSTGVLLLAQILRESGSLFQKLGYSPVIVETHHQHKKDSPSGTALLLQRAMGSGIQSTDVQIHSIRSGEIIGDHAITYYGPSDTITLEHHAMDRGIFARGAIDVALWLVKKRRAEPTLKGLIPIDRFFEDLKTNLN